MITYVLRRLGAGIILAVLVTFITYLLLAPSFEKIVRSILGTAATDANVAGRMQKLGYDRPVGVQYLDWLGGVFKGDFGRSLFTSELVGPAVTQRLGVTLSIVLPALAITVLLSIALGVIAAVRGGTIDKISQGVSLIGMLVPSLLLAIVLVLIFAVTLRWLPATGYAAPSSNFDGYLRTAAIPIFVLLIGGVANMAAQVRGAMIGELRKDYVRTLRARGMKNTTVVMQHALRNAVGPAVTVLGLEFLAMLGGALFIEKVFALPGFGTYAFSAALRGDVPVVMGITGFTVLLTVTINLLADLVNGWLNPKARLQ
ncbi:ABC transporter permease [Pseudarthrobacter sp. fls2-241-R2A-127]|uniref:ABC transporter permease n=1 Tax=Pseudarthrobacter sp. fls2-241-R2A-127 TaxID=3040303 RepID=UPI002555B005|nr:ABC transporter permease [Pseudarthrobacter sp. fls2-241-R2A-127]